MERGVIVWVGVCHGLCLSARYRAVGNAPSGLRLALDELTLRACSNASSAAEGGLLRARANRVMALDERRGRTQLGARHHWAFKLSQV